MIIGHAFYINKSCRSQLLCLTVTIFATVVALSAQAIETYQVDDFQDGTSQGWLGAVGEVIMDVGPDGVGDHSLLLDTTGFPSGVNSRLVVYHGGSSTPMETHWTGDWTTAGVHRITFDALNPNTFPLTLWLGIAGPGGPGGAGSNDAHVTKLSVTVPPDEEWHSVGFRVLAEDFETWGATGTPAIALSDVFQFRILHSSEQDWRGALGEASVLIDNIRTIPEPCTGMLVCVTLSVLCQVSRRSTRW